VEKYWVQQSREEGGGVDFLVKNRIRLKEKKKSTLASKPEEEGGGLGD